MSYFFVMPQIVEYLIHTKCLRPLINGMDGGLEIVTVRFYKKKDTATSK